MNKNKDDFSDRKDFRRKNLKNKSMDRRDKLEDEVYNPKSSKHIKKKVQDMRAEEIWEDWEDHYNK